MKTFDNSTLPEEEIAELLKRPKMDFVSVFKQVQPILEAVKQEGDKALQSYTARFDGVELEEVVADPTEIEVALKAEIKKAIDTAFDNIYRFHKTQFPIPVEVETMPGVRCMKVSRPIERVGLYVPGGTAILPSTAMMLAIPAMIAGCTTKVLATPPRKDGTVAPEIIYIAQKAGINCILKAGGAQAIAALAMGTESVPKVDKIFGPGNQYVTAAKMILQNSEAQISIDMPAGPSEVLIVADGQANPKYIAADLLSQAEHGVDSQVVLVATSEFDMEALQQVLKDQLEALPRKEIARQALDNSYALRVQNIDEGIGFSNRYAPEHLILNVENAESYSDKIMNAGSVFLGQYTPESAGDYASGTNHTLPTYGYAKMYSGVNLDAFQKSITMQSISEDGLRKLGPVVEQLAELEELDAHKNAVTIRLNDLNN
ncbi:MAG: histidinol dehydrogenase [Balneolaceae bacterium]|nr:histidinol dehydrogenase [Balneolaceae bacterium]